MRAYLTVILDSFHEAFASRVLYILLLAQTLVLAALAPLGFTEQRMLKFHVQNIHDWPAFIRELQRQVEGEGASPGKRIVEVAGDPLAKNIKEASTNNELTIIVVQEIVDELNSLITSTTLYDEAAWRGVRLRDPTKKLLDQGPANLDLDDSTALNRLLLHDAFPAYLDSIGDKELYLSYATWVMPEPLPGGKTLFPKIVKASLGAFMDLFVGTIAIFVAILVTASIIPRTFEPGAIDLLLSKPISRSLLIVAKYLGGCAFILLSATYFIIGLWLIVGLRLTVWSEKLLLCIPIFMFQFAIYYAVSMLAGVIWRNPIVSIVVTILFFLSCFTVGTTKIAVDQTLIQPYQLERIIHTTNGIVGVTRMGQFVQWNDEQRIWSDAMERSEQSGRRPMGPDMAAQIVGPIYHGPSQSLIYVSLPPTGPQPRFLISGSELLTAKWKGIWSAEAGITPPAGTSWIFQDSQSNILLVAGSGVFKYTITEGKRPTRTKILGFELPLGKADDPFTRIGPSGDDSFRAVYSAAIDHESNRLLIDNKESLMILARTDDGEKYSIQNSVKHDPDGPTLVGLTNRLAIVVAKSGHVQLRDISRLESEQRFRPAGDSPPLCVETSDDGRYTAILFHNRILWLYDDQSRQGRILNRDTTAVSFSGHELFSSDSLRRVHVRDLKTNTMTRDYSPKSDTLRWCYWWLIRPLYTIFPKPGELSNLIRTMLADDSSMVSEGFETNDLRVIRITPDTRSPVIHGAIFVLIMLGITCAYVERLDL